MEKIDNKITDEFVSTLSHEIRTPLTSIKGFAQTILDNYDSFNDEQKKKFLNIIAEQSQRLVNLVENVLNVAKLEEEEDLVIKEIDPEFIVKKTLELVKINCKDRIFNIKTEENISNVIGDYDKLQQVLTNIFDNACKYSDDKIDINILKSGKIEVIDYGVGITDSQKDMIFEKFYRAQNLLTGKTQGSGLGLYIAKSLIEKMNGNIGVESKEGFTKFSIELPVFEVEKITKKVTT